jgi:hypothetical protein
MGCNCGTNQAAKTYVYTAPNGSTKTYRTEVEARAAVIRSGGSYRVT